MPTSTRRLPIVRTEIEESGGIAVAETVDVSRSQDAERFVRRAVKTSGRFDVLVNNAGIHDQAPFWEEPLSLSDRMYRVNVLGTVLPSQTVVRHMKDHGGGAIVQVASKAGVVGEPGHAATPLDRLGNPTDIAEAVLYLASGERARCTGQAPNVDGGLSILK